MKKYLFLFLAKFFIPVLIFSAEVVENKKDELIEYNYCEKMGLEHQYNVTFWITFLTCVVTCLAWVFPDLEKHLINYPYRSYHFGEWYRCFTGGLLHSGLFHLFFNMVGLYQTGSYLEAFYSHEFGSKLGAILYFLLYGGAILISGLVGTFLNAENIYYRSLGASSGVVALLFNYILFHPFSSMLIYPTIALPGWLYGVVYLLLTSYMARGSVGRINHMAHFLGSLYGIAFTLLAYPDLREAYLILLRDLFF